MLLAMLCVALAMVLAAASATSVADNVQHETGVAHEHGAHLSFVAVDDHAATDAAGPDHSDDMTLGYDDEDASDPTQGAGHHHHADGPVGAPGGSVSVDVAGFAGVLSSAEPRETDPKGVRPGGLERPPRALAILV